jgi:hypothetical protein
LRGRAGLRVIRILLDRHYITSNEWAFSDSGLPH